MSERCRQPLDRRPSSVQPSVVDPRDVCLGNTGALRQLRLRPPELDPPLADRITRMCQFSQLCPRSHETSVCVFPHHQLQLQAALIDHAGTQSSTLGGPSDERTRAASALTFQPLHGSRRGRTPSRRRPPHAAFRWRRLSATPEPSDRSCRRAECPPPHSPLQ